MSRPLEIYRGYREDLPAGDVAALLQDVHAHFAGLVRAQERNELVAVDLAELLCERLEILLAAAPALDAEVRAEIVGAARYFISVDDAVPDDQSCVGLDDDITVFNHVVRAIGRPDLEVPG
jgi:uncharacterized membrane protein YkvA (DUF1232 family)